MTDPIGHDRLRRDLARAAGADRLPGSLLFHGPAGVGKQRMALWLARRVMCENAEAMDVEPCGTCTSCKLAARLEHPDIHWYFPTSNIPGSREKRIEAFEAARNEEIGLRRDFRWSAPDGVVGYFVDQILGLRRAAEKRPVMGRRKVFIVGDAERLVPQEASPEAANALLKMLEEPADDALYILTASDPERLLPTIRSRLLPIRVDPLPEQDVSDHLARIHGIEPERADLLARVARGSVGRALELLGEDGAAGPFGRQRQSARELLAAVARPDPVGVVAASHAASPAQARGEFSGVLDSLQIWLRDLAAVAVGAHDDVANVDALDWLRTVSDDLPAVAAGTPAAMDAVARAQTLAAGNLNPQLILAQLLPSLRRSLGASGRKR